MRWLVVALLLLGACQRAATAGDAVRIGLATEPPHLNPLLHADATTLQVALGDVYEPLFTIDADEQVVPVLATSATLSDDGRQLELALRQGVRWHDGTPFGAADVVYTLGLLRPGGAPSVLASDFDDLETIEALPDGGVRLRFAGFRLGRLRTLALVPMLPAHVFAASDPGAMLEHPATRAPVGTGPLAFASWTPGRAIELRRAASFRGPPARSARVTYVIVADRQQAVAQLRRGELDVVLQVPQDLEAQLVGDASVHRLAVPGGTYLAARWNCRRLPDAEVRQALTMLLDRQAVVRELMRGHGRVAASPWAPDDDAHDPALAPVDFDVERAGRLIRERAGGPLRVRLLVAAGSTLSQRVATLWQADAARAGVTLDIVSSDDVIGRARAGDFDGLIYAWSTGPEQDLTHHFASPPLGSENYGACQSRGLDEALALIRTTPDRERRLAIERGAEHLLAALHPVTVIAHLERTLAFRAWLGPSLPVTDDGRVPAAQLGRQR
jgi:peptide/nickel transport system substrate-binding protein